MQIQKLKPRQGPKSVFDGFRQRPHICPVNKKQPPFMPSQRFLYIVSCCCLSLLSLHLPAQAVWPGDVNNNGIANGVDLLWMGIAYGAEGPERPGASIIWQAQPLGSLWAQSFPGGLNYAYADADGDGEIDDNDIDDALLANFRKTHGTLQPDGYANAAPGSGAPAITLSPSTFNAIPGQVITVDVLLGDAQHPVSDFYGVAFTLQYSRELVENNGQEFYFDDDDDSWIAPEADDPLEHLFYRDAPGGQAEVAFVRTNQIPVNEGSGVIGTFSIIIEDIIVGLNIDTFILQMDSIRVIDETNTVMPIVPDTLLIIVSDPNSTPHQPNALAALRMHPNPAAAGTDSWVRAHQSVRQIEVLDALGRPTGIPVTQQSEKAWRIRWPAHTPPGMYTLCAHGAGGMLHKRIILH